MADIILLKQFTEIGKVPVPADLTEGEFVVNTADRILYSKDSNDIIFNIAQPFQGQALIFDSAQTSDVAEIILNVFPVNLTNATRYIISMTSGTDHHMLEISLVHNSTLVQITEFSVLRNAASLGTFSTDITDGFVRLKFSPANSITTVQFSRSDVKKIQPVDTSVLFSSVTSSTIDQFEIDFFDNTIIRSRSYDLEINDVVNNHFEFLNFSVISNGIAISSLVSGRIGTNSNLGSIDAELSGTDVRVLFTPTNASTVINKAIRSLSI